MLLKDFIAEGVASLRDLYPEEEARSLVLMLCAAKLGVQRYTHLIEPQTEIPPGREEELSEAMERLRDAEPVQYVTGVASFCGHDFRVTRDVLIPRPETECLVREACEAAEALARMKTAAGRAGEPLRILDLCTGSGCIAWSLSLALPGARVTGVDVSEAALEVARGQAFGRELRRTWSCPIPPTSWSPRRRRCGATSWTMSPPWRCLSRTGTRCFSTGPSPAGPGTAFRPGAGDLRRSTRTWACRPGTFLLRKASTAPRSGRIFSEKTA